MAPKKKASKKVPSVGLRGKKEKPFRVRLWRTYKSEKGPNIRIVRKDCDGDYHGESQPGMWSPVWKPDGQPWISGRQTDDAFGALVREVVKRRGK